jgi:hypothetical protein
MHLTCFEHLWAESARSRSSANINNSLSAKEASGVRAPTSPNALSGDYHIIWGGTSHDNSNQELVLSEDKSNQDQTVTPAQARLKHAGEHCVSLGLGLGLGNEKPAASYTAKAGGNGASSQRPSSHYPASDESGHSQHHHLAPARIKWLSSDPFFSPAQQGLEKTLEGEGEAWAKRPGELGGHLGAQPFVSPLGGEPFVEPLPNRPATLSGDQAPGAPVNAPCPDFCNTLPNSPVDPAAKQTRLSLRREESREMHEREPPKQDRCAPVAPGTSCRGTATATATATPQPHSALSQRKEECGARESAARQGESVCGPPSAPSHISSSLTSSTSNHQHQEK